MSVFCRVAHFNFKINLRFIKLEKIFIGLDNVLMAVEAPDILEVPDVGVIDDVTNAAKVILFNDEWHTFDEVIGQLIKATKCSHKRAEKLAWEVHTRGKACVYDGEMSECLRVSSILEEIALHTQVEY